MAKRALSEIRELTPDQGRALLDARARAELKMSGPTFARLWKAGRFRNADCGKVLRVAMLLPFAGVRRMKAVKRGR